MPDYAVRIERWLHDGPHRGRYGDGGAPPWVRGRRLAHGWWRHMGCHGDLLLPSDRPERPGGDNGLPRSLGGRGRGDQEGHAHLAKAVRGHPGQELTPHTP